MRTTNLLLTMPTTLQTLRRFCRIGLTYAAPWALALSASAGAVFFSQITDTIEIANPIN